MIAELYPTAWTHLKAAQRAREAVSQVWAGLVDGLVDATVVTEPDGTGRIIVFTDWPSSARTDLTDAFARCVAELWAGLDSLVAESVMMFSNLRRPRDPDAPRYFPVAPSAEQFQALLADSCLDGILQTQFQMVHDCQSFHDDSGDERLDERYRRALRQLVDWSHRLGEGAQVGAWATPAEPQVYVEAPVRVIEVACQAPAELDEELVVARFVLDGYTPDCRVEAQPGTFIDLALPDGFVPDDFADTLQRRLDVVIATVTRFASVFAEVARRTAVTPRLLVGAETGVPWTDARRSDRGWTGSELDQLAGSDLGIGVVRDADHLVLLVTTPDGIYERRIPDATPLRPQIASGIAAERATQEAAATWGLPDFVMRPLLERKGRGVREISDGLLVVGDRGVIVQVKSRNVDPRNAEREARWIDKQIGEAIGQADGTARRLSARTAQMTNGRGRSVTIDGSTIAWVTAVIINHPSPPPNHPIPSVNSQIPAVVLLRRDWEFLFSQLRSTRAVADYLHRVGTSTELLGTEAVRYYELAAADAEAAARPTTPEHDRYAGQRRSVPLLPAAPAGIEDDEAHGIVRILCEDIATSPANGHDEADRIRVLALIDRLPVGHRAALGRRLIDGLREIRNHEDGKTAWAFRTFRPDRPDDVQLGFGVCSDLSDVTREAFRSWFLLRHHERRDFDTNSSATSVGVLLTPRHDGLREWDTTMIAVTGDPELSPDEVDQLDRFWNRQTQP